MAQCEDCGKQMGTLQFGICEDCRNSAFRPTQQENWFQKSAEEIIDIHTKEKSNTPSEVNPQHGEGTESRISKQDNSMKVAVGIMVLFGILGLGVGGLGGAVLGAIFGFGITVMVYSLQEYFGNR